jgi:hypothetical protein
MLQQGCALVNLTGLLARSYMWGMPSQPGTAIAVLGFFYY